MLKLKILCFGSCLFFLSCGTPKAQEGTEVLQKPNILMISIDDLNDWIGAMGYSNKNVTPNIDKLARKGVLFNNAHC